MSTKKILSMDGGGSKGVFHLYFLQELEAVLKGCVRDKFDSIGGTSVGGIIALTLTHPLGYMNNRNDFYVSELLDKKLDEKLLEAVFGKPRSWGQLPRLGVFGPKYADRDKHTKDFYEKELFGKTTFGGDCTPFTMVFSYSLTHTCAKVFKSWRPDFQSVPLSVIARATSAAPMFFPAVDYDGEVMIDGGVAANDPSYLMGYEMRKNLGDFQAPLVIVSIGLNMKGLDNYSACYNGGLLAWAQKFTYLSMETQQRIVTYLQGHDNNCALYCDGCVENHFHEVLGAAPNQCLADYHYYNNVHYFRFTPIGSGVLDSIDPKMFATLKTQAKAFFNCDSKIITKMISLLA